MNEALKVFGLFFGAPILLGIILGLTRLACTFLGQSACLPIVFILLMPWSLLFFVSIALFVYGLYYVFFQKDFLQKKAKISGQILIGPIILALYFFVILPNSYCDYGQCILINLAIFLIGIGFTLLGAWEIIKYLKEKKQGDF